MKGTNFILPKFTDDGVCIITNYEVSQIDTAVLNPGSNFISDPSPFSSDTTYK